MELWRQLKADAESVHIMRNKVHSTMIAVAKEAIRSSAKPEREDKQLSSRIDPATIQSADLSVFQRVVLSDKYNCAAGYVIAEWLTTLVDMAQPPRAMSWFQLNALFEYQTQSRGVRYNKSRKKWENGKDYKKLQDFVTRTHGLSRWVQGVANEKGSSCKPVHLRPHSTVLTFWCMCLPIHIQPAQAILADEILRCSATTLTSVKTLRSL